MLTSLREQLKPVSSENSAKEGVSIGVNQLDLLSAMDILRDLPESEIKGLINKSPMHTAKKGAMIFEQEGPEVLFLLKSGRAEIYQLSPEGKKLTLAIVEQGTILGEMSLIGQQLEGTCAVAVEDSVICALSRHDVESLILEHPSVGLHIIEILALRLQETRSTLKEMTFNNVTGRVASLLLNLTGENSNVIKGYSHQDLADRVGCLRESFTSVIDRFKSTQAVATGRKRIQITDRSQLERVVAGAPSSSAERSVPDQIDPFSGQTDKNKLL